MVLPLLKRTLATFLSPELGFLGFVTPTLIHTPFIAGQWDLANCGDVGFRARCPTLQPRMTWLYVADRVMLVEKKRVAERAAAAAVVVVMAEVVEVALMAAMGRKQARVVDERRKSAVKTEAMSLSARLSVRMKGNGSFWYGVVCCGSMVERDEVEGRSGSPPRECSTLTLTLSFDVVPSPRAKLSKS